MRKQAAAPHHEPLSRNFLAVTRPRHVWSLRLRRFLKNSDDFLRNLLDTFLALRLYTRLQLVKDNTEQLNPLPKNWIPLPELSRDRVLAVLGATRTSYPANHHL